MIQLKSRFGTERSPFSPVEKIALRIVQIVGYLKHDIARDLQSRYLEDIYFLVDLLNSRVNSTDAARVVEICADIPVQLEWLRHDTVATTVREMLNDFKNRSPDEGLVEISYIQIQPGDHWRDGLGGEYQAVQGRVGGRDVVLSYPLTGFDAFKLQSVLPPEMRVIKVIRH